MSLRNRSTNIWAAVIALMTFAAVAIWQFYLFAKYEDSRGLLDVQGGAHHLWWAIGATLIACIAGFYVFSIFVRYDKDDELHITA
jgi:heme/copper-type cytochrome/quinol oxidase subunit 2